MAAKKQSVYRDWAGEVFNFCSGCSNACRYCYVTDMGCKFKWTNLEDRHTMFVDHQKVSKKQKDYGTQVMVPSSHDITPEILDPAIEVLQNLIDAGNKRILLVTKPHMECVEAICKKFGDQKDCIVWRFTIGSLNDDILEFWEPGATKVQERLACLAHAYEAGFTTSVSVEPMLDVPNIEELVERVSPYVNQTIWLGMMSPRLYFLKKNLGDEFNNALNTIYENQTVENLSKIYEKFKSHPKIRFTGATRKKLGVPALPPEYL
jgi:DNA repair photolyase